ncbi:unnamed protein product [Adineta ricciae]|uniref:Uncharacterized protein n=1 Tax=Adineta ricciae TaxID=249248 RepID=A0A816DQC7_ADIRI|nr:unnamed protein product [Adineta ricciae]
MLRCSINRRKCLLPLSPSACLPPIKPAIIYRIGQPQKSCTRIESTTKKYCNKNTAISMSSNGGDNYAALETALREAIIFGNCGDSAAFDKRLDHAANILTNSFSYSTCSQVDSTTYETKT